LNFLNFKKGKDFCYGLSKQKKIPNRYSTILKKFSKQQHITIKEIFK